MKVHTANCAHSHLAPASAAEVVTSAARAERFDVRDLALRARFGGNPVLPLAGAWHAEWQTLRSRPGPR
jgi:hypothetical protein